MKDFLGNEIINDDHVAAIYNQHFVIGKVRLCKKQLAITIINKKHVIHKYPYDCIKVSQADVATFLLTL